jgi:hypothetical protein
MDFPNFIGGKEFRRDAFAHILRLCEHFEGVGMLSEDFLRRDSNLFRGSILNLHRLLDLESIAGTLLFSVHTCLTRAYAQRLHNTSTAQEFNA